MIIIPILRVDEIRIEPHQDITRDDINFGFRVSILPDDLNIIFSLTFEHNGYLGTCIHHKSIFRTAHKYYDDSSYLRCIEQLFNQTAHEKIEYHSGCSHNIIFDHSRFVFDYGWLEGSLRELFQQVFHRKNTLPHATRV